MLVLKRSLLLLLSAGAVSAFTTQKSTRSGSPSFLTRSDSVSVVHSNVISKNQRVLLFSDVSAADETPATESANVSTGSKDEDKEKYTAYVVNMSYDTTEETLNSAFAEYGTVTNIYMPTDRDSGKPRGFAFVSLSTQEELDKVLEAMAEVSIDQRTVYVTKARSKSEKTAAATQTDVKKVYVGNVSFDTTKSDLTTYFSETGTVLDVYCPTHQDTGLPRGFAFVTMSASDAENAIETHDGKEFMGRSLSVRESLPRGQKLKEETKDEVKLYIGNISFNLEEDDLSEIFSEYGEIVDLYMPKDRETGRPRGFAFCTMSKESCTKAIEATDGYELDGRILRVNEAQPKGFAPVDNYDNGGEGDTEDW